MTEKKHGALRRRVRQSGAGRARRYSSQLRTDVMSALVTLRDEGWSWERLAEELDISIETLRCWRQDIDLEHQRESSSSGSLPVRLVGQPIGSTSFG